MAQKLQTY
jgi:hypothetical protein